MSTVVWVIVAVVLVALIAGAGYLLWTRARSQQLRRQFGPEYDRAIERHGSRAAAEKELHALRQRHRELDIRPLDPRQLELYREQWTHVQERFVDTPESAVEQADRLVVAVMGERGYPTEGFEDQMSHLAVEHGRNLDHYRRARDITHRAAGKEASTEDLRQAMVHYRALFEDLLAVPEGERAPVPDGTPAATPANGRVERAEQRDRAQEVGGDERAEQEQEREAEEARQAQQERQAEQAEQPGRAEHGEHRENTEDPQAAAERRNRS